MTDDKHPRANAEIPVADAALAAITGLGPQLTDEQWAERDRAVQAERNAALRAGLERTRRERVTALHDAGFPRRALDEAAAADEAAPPIVRVAAWDVAKNSTLVISGGNGCGKTVAATWWALRFPGTPRFLRASTLAASSRYDRDERSAILAAPALVLDDLGAEYMDSKGSFLVDLDELLDVFYGDYRPLLITTNAAFDVFRSRIGERVADRLRECGSFWATTAPSRRTR